jgi:hypothetical protein
MKIQGMSFASPSTIVCEIQEIFNEICITEWVKVFDDWEVGQRQCIDIRGEYFSSE